MFLTQKCSSLLPPNHHHSDAARPKASSQRKQQLLLTAKAACFDAALAARLRGLLPGPAPSSPLAALARLADLLALTLAEAAPALAGEGDAAAVAAHLDAGVALLDACNAITARLERLRRRRLLARFALHLLSSSPLLPLPTLPFDQPCDRLSAAARVFVAVSAVSSVATAAGWGAGRNRLLQPSHFQPAEQDLQFFIKSKSPPFRLGNSFCDDKVQEVFPFTQPFQVPISLLLRSPADRGNNAH